MRLLLLCKYCGHSFIEYLYSYQDSSILKCPICKDTNLKQVKDERKDVFGYDSTSPKEDAYIKKGD